MKGLMKLLVALMLGTVLVMMMGCENGSSDNGGDGNTELAAQDLIGTWESNEHDSAFSSDITRQIKLTYTFSKANFSYSMKVINSPITSEIDTITPLGDYTYTANFTGNKVEIAFNNTNDNSGGEMVLIFDTSNKKSFLIEGEPEIYTEQ